MDMYDKYKISQLILHIHIYKMKINIQQGSHIQYIYITVSLLVDSSGWSFDSKLKKKIDNANKNNRKVEKRELAYCFCSHFSLAISHLLTCS